MSASEKASIIAGVVIIGDELPALNVPITTTSIVLGAMASRDWRPMHHDKDFAVNRNGVKNVFVNTPNNASWFERYITDWTGPKGRLGRMKFKMMSPVFPGDVMELSGSVSNLNTDETGCCWLELQLTVSVDGKVSTSCHARVAIPVDAQDNPWKRKGLQWQP